MTGSLPTITGALVGAAAALALAAMSSSTASTASLPVSGGVLQVFVVDVATPPPIAVPTATP